MPSHKKQHFIPKTYLSAWCDPTTPDGQTPFVWKIEATTGHAIKKSPEKLFRETDMYTINMPDGSRDLRIEYGLQQVEQGLASLRKQFLEPRNIVPDVRRAKLLAFLSALSARTPRFRDHHRKQWRKVLKLGEELEASVAKMAPEERRKAPAPLVSSRSSRTMTMDQVKLLVDHPIQVLLPSVIQSELPILVQMRSIVMFAPAGSAFITSDNPVSKAHPKSKIHPIYGSPGIAGRDIEITLPLSPRMALMVCHDQPMSRGLKPIEYFDAPAEAVRQINLRTAAGADEFLVSSAPGPDWAWIGLERLTQDDDDDDDD
ncbi:DUF4238 domain-containing protein [Rhizobium sp. TH2]|uniref:DUF4238 domain-containing protein n=1 Tax=Rhizobium sp. TH2 TaxID=2775403 RepID=UPI0021571E89|nr:DUF4238 domain-containing protein [Rhizobium sp. TH2]UVC08254.1 DUF4238 domain-containing protein [Rhizobium sp. TH2]